MIVVTVNVLTKYYFTNKTEEKIKNYAKEQGLTYVDAIYALIDMGELDLEFDSDHENTDNPEIVDVEET